MIPFCQLCDKDLSIERCPENWATATPDGCLSKRTLCAACIYTFKSALEEKRALRDDKQCGRRTVPTWTLFALRPKQDAVYFVVRTADFAHHKDKGLGTPEYRESQKYYYEEHTCPTNFIGAEQIGYAGDWDAHGLFEYVAEIPDSGEEKPEDLMNEFCLKGATDGP